jgi:hypothetical protein
MKPRRQGRLGDVEERPLEIVVQFKSFEDYWQPFLSGQGPAGAFVKRLSPERWMALRDQVMLNLPAGAQHTVALSLALGPSEEHRLEHETRCRASAVPATRHSFNNDADLVASIPSHEVHAARPLQRVG